MSGWTEKDKNNYYDRLKKGGGADCTRPISSGLSNASPARTSVGDVQVLDTGEPIIITLNGRVPSKKNNYRPRPDGRGVFKDSKLQSQLDALALQIPGKFRDLRLESPDVDFFFVFSGKANWDRDNATTCLIDLLVEYGTFQNDNIRRFNGKLTIHPAEKSEVDMVTIVIHPRPEYPSLLQTTP